MSAKTEIEEFMNQKRLIKSDIIKLESDIKALDQKMVQIASTELNVKIGDTFDSHSAKMLQISEFDEVQFDHTLEMLALRAKCYELKKDGSIDKRVDPRYNIKTVGVIK